MSLKFTKDEIDERERYEQKHGNPLKFDVALGPDYIKIGDEIFSHEDLEKPEPVKSWPNAPFTEHHRKVQEALDDLRAFYDKYPERKMRLKWTK